MSSEPHKENRKNVGLKRYLKKKMAEKFSNLAEDLKLHNQEVK